jgi:hypothetical protein
LSWIDEERKPYFENQFWIARPKSPSADADCDLALDVNNRIIEQSIKIEDPEDRGYLLEDYENRETCWLEITPAECAEIERLRESTDFGLGLGVAGATEPEMMEVK